MSINNVTGLLSGNQHGHRSTHPRPRHNAEGFITHNDEFKKQAEDGSFLEEGERAKDFTEDHCKVMAEMPLGSSLHAFLIDVALTHYADHLHTSHRSRRIGDNPGGLDLQDVQAMSQQELCRLGLPDQVAKSMRKKAARFTHLEGPMLESATEIRTEQRMRHQAQFVPYLHSKWQQEQERLCFHDFVAPGPEYARIGRWHHVNESLLLPGRRELPGTGFLAGVVVQPTSPPVKFSGHTQHDRRILQRLLQKSREARCKELRESSQLETCPRLYAMAKWGLGFTDEGEVISQTHQR